MGENSGTLKDAARQGVLARLAELAGVPAQEIEEALGTIAKKELLLESHLT